MNPIAARFLAIFAAIGALFVGTRPQPAQADYVPDYDPQPEPQTGDAGLDLIPAENKPTTGYERARRDDTVVSVRRAGAGWTEVVCADGRIERREGVRAWRNNNPGNIEYGNFAKSLGAVGTDGRFAVFPTYEAGRAAKAALIFDGGNYRNLSLTAAIARYAPPSENNTARYASTVIAAAGSDKRMADFLPDERARILDAMERVEGFKVGTYRQTDGSAFA